MQDNTLNQNPSPTFPTAAPPPPKTDNGSAAPADSAATTQPQSDFAPPTPKRRALIPTILGIVLLVVGVSAGLLLVQQQQIFKQKATGGAGACDGPADGSGLSCIADNLTDSCTSDKKCQYLSGEHGFARTNNCECPTGYTTSGNFCLWGGAGRNCALGNEKGSHDAGVRCDAQTEAFCAGQTGTTGGGGSGCGCYGSGECRDKVGSEGTGATHPANECQTGSNGTCVWNPSACGATGGTTTTTPSKKACGQTCSQDSECVTGAQDQGITVGCINGICANRVCPTKTIPGAICSCDTLNACGQPCNAAVGLCQAGSQCGFITGNTQCTPPGTIGDITKTFCIPQTPNNGYTTGQCTGIATIYLKKPDGTVVNTQADVIAACQPAATASCTGLTAYDTNWNLLTSAQLSALKAGDKVRFTAAGTTTSGVFDKARFTINSTLQPEVTTKRPNSVDFYDEYTIPAGVTSFSVTAQIHHQVLNQWF